MAAVLGGGALRTTTATLTVACALCASVAVAQPADRGPARDALPGASRVGWAPPATRLGGAALARGGYGILEGAEGEGGDHQRVEGSIAVSAQPHANVALALGADGRVDVHPRDALGEDTSALAFPWLLVRAGADIGGGVALGGDLRWDVHGGAAPSFEPLASRLTLRALATWRPTSAVTLGLAAGARFDGTGSSLDEARTPHRTGDRVSLDVNHGNALLLGAAGAWAYRDLEIFGELTWEPLGGSGAPPVERAPLRLATGARALFAPGWSAELTVEIGLAARAPVALDQLVEVEPRSAVLATLAYRLDLGPAAAPPGRRTIEGRVHGPDGSPVEAATVVVIGADGRAIAETRSTPSGQFTLTLAASERPRGLAVSAPRFRRAVRALEAETVSIAIELVPAGALLRGSVRDFAGQPVRAAVQLDGASAGTTAADGSFEASIELGAHVLEITADGFVAQRRELTIREGGVFILHVDLRRAY
jgi:hypothetical protein